MNRVEELIQQLCPNGVEWKKLGEVCLVTIGEFVHKNKQSDTGKYPVYNGGISYTGFYDEFNNTGNKIIISARGANAGYVNRAFCNYWAGNSCYSLSVITGVPLDWTFLFYYLKNRQSDFTNIQQKGGIPAVSKNQICDFEIPIPPLSIQQEIVRILDTFTELTANLQTELDARKKQYAYYRDCLLNFEGVDGVEWKKLGEMCDFQNGFSFKSSTFKKQGKPILRITNIKDSIIDTSSLVYFEDMDYIGQDLSQFKVVKGDIVIAMSGATTGKLGYLTSDEIFYLNQRVGKFVPKSNLDRRYLFHYLQLKTNDIYVMAGGGAQPNLSSTKLLNDFSIPIPPLPEQRRIVAILDKFETLVNDLSVGLPAELEARRKQYEYYRDKLLTFDRV